MGKLPSANKELGQHFLRDQKVISNITNDWKEEADVIVEVGPGPAVLTKFLAEHNKPYFVIEMDDRFKPLLEEHVNSENIFMQDALKFEWEEFITANNLEDKKIWLVSNLPYNVGTILFTNFLQVPQIKYMSLMFQKEVGDKTYLRQEKNQMNGLLALSLNYFKSRQLCKVAPGCFSPPPKVDSVVVSYERLSEPKISVNEYKSFNRFTRVLFGQKRKQIQGILKNYYKQHDLPKIFKETEISGQLRAEALSLDQIYQLYFALN